MIHSHYISYIEQFTSEPDIHDIRRSGLSAAEISFGFVVSIVFLVLDTVLVFIASKAILPAALCLFVHVVAIGLVSMVVTGKTKAGMEANFSRVLVMLIALTGPFGAIGGIISLLAHTHQRNFSLSFKEWFDFIYPRPSTMLGEKLYDGIVLGTDEHPRPYDVVPFMDIMRIGNEAQKREAINQMTMHFHPSFSGAFELALKDDSHVVRTLAAIGVVKIQNHFSRIEEKLQLSISTNEHRAEYLLAAGKFYDDFAFSGLLDKQRRDEYLNNAYDYYQRYVQKNPADMQVTAWIGRLLIKSGQYERAAEWLRKPIDGGYTEPSVLAWYAEVLYMLGRFNDVRQLLRVHGQKLSTLYKNSAMSDVITLWHNSPQEAFS